MFNHVFRNSYLCKTKEAIKEYLPLFERKKQEILSDGKLKGDIDIVVSLEIAMNQVAKVEPEALKLLFYCAFLPAKKIPKNLLVKLFDSDRVKLNRYLSVLDTLILSETDQISIHDLFQEIIEERVKMQKKGIIIGSR